MQEFVVKEERVNKAIEIVQARIGKLSSEKVMMVMWELEHMYDHTSYSPEMTGLRMHLTDLQFVALAAALVAVEEAGGWVKD